MKVLVLSDVEEKGLWEYFDKEKFKDIDFIVSCGDLDPQYLEFIVTMSNLPLFYVRGNHDDIYSEKSPRGCLSIDGKTIVHEGIRIAGLGGSIRYREGMNMYSESEMRKRIRKMQFAVRRIGGIDLLVTHAPAKGYGDLEDLPHQGFLCFNNILGKWGVKIMVHGHIHPTYVPMQQRRFIHESGTEIINCFGQEIIKI